MSLRLGERPGRAERVERLFELPPGLVAEGDACHWRTKPRQSPTQNVEWCGTVQAVHLRSLNTTAAGADGLRLSRVRGFRG
jgi:hypothetical protein